MFFFCGPAVDSVRFRLKSRAIRRAAAAAAASRRRSLGRGVGRWWAAPEGRPRVAQRRRRQEPEQRLHDVLVKSAVV